MGEGEQDGGAADTHGFGGLLGEVGIGDVFEEAAGAEALKLPAGNRGGVEVVAAEQVCAAGEGGRCAGAFAPEGSPATGRSVRTGHTLRYDATVKHMNYFIESGPGRSAHHRPGQQ